MIINNIAKLLQSNDSKNIHLGYTILSNNYIENTNFLCELLVKLSENISNLEGMCNIIAKIIWSGNHDYFIEYWYQTKIIPEIQINNKFRNLNGVYLIFFLARKKELVGQFIFISLIKKQDHKLFFHNLYNVLEMNNEQLTNFINDIK